MAYWRTVSCLYFVFNLLPCIYMFASFSAVTLLVRHGVLIPFMSVKPKDDQTNH